MFQYSAKSPSTCFSSKSSFKLTCSLVFTTSKGLTAAAEIDPAVMPATNDHLKSFIRNDKMYYYY